MILLLLILEALLTFTIGDDHQCSKFKAQENISKWSKKVFKSQDKKRAKKYWYEKHIGDSNVDDLRNHFYEMSSQTLQNHCQNIKRVGGQWLGGCGYLDGEKLICMDKLYKSVKKDECLVYSFGIGKLNANIEINRD